MAMICSNFGTRSTSSVSVLQCFGASMLHMIIHDHTYLPEIEVSSRLPTNYSSMSSVRRERQRNILSSLWLARDKSLHHCDQSMSFSLHYCRRGRCNSDELDCASLSVDDVRHIYIDLGYPRAWAFCPLPSCPMWKSPQE